METTTQSEFLLRAHLDRNGKVWVSSTRPDAYMSPTNTNLPISKLEKYFEKTPASTIRVVGMASNAPLIRYLYNLDRSLGLRRLQVGTPSVCINSRERDTPYLLLRAAEKLQYPPSVGGWHSLSEAEANSWRFIDDRFIQDDDLFKYRMIHHPAAVAAIMLKPKSLSSISAGALWSTIVDPRWHVDPGFPDKKNRLWAYLGLWPRVVSDLVASCGGSERGRRPAPATYKSRAAIAVTAWANCIPTERQIMESASRSFVWRYCERRFVEGLSQKAAIMRATQMYVDFVRQVWLDSLSSAELFVPRYFFQSAADLRDYERAVIIVQTTRSEMAEKFPALAV